jgi:hypothetical protein
VLNKKTAKHYLDLSLSLQKNIVYALENDKQKGLARQEQSSWTIRTSRNPDPIDEKTIASIKDEVCSRHVGFIEGWKDVKTDWPISPYKKLAWNTFARTFGKDQPMYQLRDWFSHRYSKRGTKFRKE